jgi:hypothetical protein
MRKLLSILACAAFGGVLLADQITLTNGDRVSGKITKKEADTLSIKSDLLGDVTVKWKDVAGVTVDAPVTVVLPQEMTVKGTVATTGDKVVVTTPSGPAEAPLAEVGAMRNDAEQRRYERLLHPPWTDLWAGYADFSIANASGNARSLTLTTALSAVRLTRHDKTSLYFNQIFGRALVRVGESNVGVMQDTASAVRGGWQYNHTISDRLFWNVFNDYEYDRFQSLDLRTVVGGGLGYSAIKSEKKQLDLVGGGSWNHESYSTPITIDNGEPKYDRSAGEIYWGDDFLWKLTGTAAMKQSFRMFNNMGNLGEYRANFDLGLDTKLWKAVSWQLTFSDRYISNPAPFRKTNDLLISSGIRYTFSRMP